MSQASRQRFRSYLDRRRKAGHDQSVQDRAAKTPDRPSRTRSIKQLTGAFWNLLQGHRWTLGVCLALVASSVGIALVAAFSTKFVLDYVILDTPGPAGIEALIPFALPDGTATALGEMQTDRAARWPLLIATGAALMTLAPLSAGIHLWGRWNSTKLAKVIQVKVRRLAFAKAVTLPLPRISELKSGGVASLLRDDTASAGDLLFSLVHNPWRAVIQLVGTLVFLAVLDWRMLAGALLIIPIVLISQRTWVARIRPVYRDIRRTRERIDAQATEIFGGIRVVRGFHRERAESARFGRDSHYMTRQEILAWWWTRLIEQAWEVVIPLASASVLLYGGYRVLNSSPLGDQPGDLSIGDMMLFMTLVTMLLGPMEALVSTATQVQTNLAGLDRVLDLLDEQGEFESTAAQQGAPLNPRTVEGRITLENVWFRYPPRRSRKKKTEPRPDVIQGVNLEARPGQMIAFVGQSGAGKTTLCNLIARFYDPTQGRITIDGRDLTEIPLDDYRRLLGIVEQDVFLFDGSVADNIAYARRDATEADIRRAAEAANAAEFIDQLEDGFDTLIGERGLRLSGGQKQRIAIARAILADPRILILDEATSNLDSESERLIQNSLATLMSGRTSFVIAHRLSTIRHADQIAVLDHGELIELGTHEQLNEAGGRYADLLRLQLEPPETRRAEDEPITDHA